MATGEVIEKDTKLIEGFEHRPGKHCGSTALADLFRFYGLDLPEAVVFGLAAGPCFYYVELPQASPTKLVATRAARMEHEFAELTDGLLRLESEKIPEAAWSKARAHLDQGAPTLLLTDLYYLDHYDNSAHFSGHAVVAAGYDDESVYLADTDFEGLIRTPLSSLAKARHSKVPPFPLEGELFTVNKDRLTVLKDELPELTRKSINFAARQMLEPEFAEIQGLPALERLAQDVAKWPEEAEDWQWCARFAYQVIERRGTGGGAFRKLYAEFLRYADREGHLEGLAESAERCAQLAEQWTELSEIFRAASRAEADSESWQQLTQQVELVCKGEERLWTGLLAVI